MSCRPVSVNHAPYLELDGAVKDETDHMIIFVYQGNEAWLPIDYVEYHDMTTVLIPEWLAFQKGLI